MKKRFLSFILILSMFITVLPTQVMAKEENDVDMDTSYSNGTANSALASDAITSLFQTAIKTLANKTGTKIGDWTSQQFFSLIFGTEESDTQKILQAIEEVNEKQDEILKDLDDIKEMLKKQSTINEISDMMKNSSGSLFTLTCEYMEALKVIEPGYEEQGRKDVLIWNMGDDPGGDPSQLNTAHAAYDTLVLTFGNRLLDINTLLDGDDRRSLDLMNKYDLQVNKWEHQGYEMRENYWNSLMNLYITSASLMKTSLIARMEEYKKYLPNSRANFLEGVMTLLEKQLEKIVQLADETAVKRLDSNIRHYQKPGHDVYMYTSTVKQDISNLIKTAYIYNYKSEAENKVNKFWVPMYTVQSGSLKGKVGLTAQEYQMIYDDYNPKGSKNEVSMYDIFFGKENGNLTPPSDISSNPLFVSSSVWTKTLSSKRYWFGGGKDWYYYVCCSLFEGNNGKHYTWNKGAQHDQGKNLVNDIYTVMSYYADVETNIFRHLPGEDQNRLVMVVSAKENLNQSPALDNHEVVDSWKYDEEKHWKECEDGDIVSPEDHSLNWITDRQPTSDVVGLKHQECSVCGYKGETVESSVINSSETVEPTKVVKKNTSQATIDTVKKVQNDVPNTGYNGNCNIWFALLTITGALIISTGCRKQKNNKD